MEKMTASLREVLFVRLSYAHLSEKGGQLFLFEGWISI